MPLYNFQIHCSYRLPYTLGKKCVKIALKAALNGVRMSRDRSGFTCRLHGIT